jgi:phenylacetate-CoA oxygenase PaaH subunit
VRIYEVFLKKAGKDPFVHAGSFEASDDELAVVLARESYSRRGEGDEMWLVARDHVIDVDAEFLAPNSDKVHRQNDGQRVAEHRRRQRADPAAGRAAGQGAAS